MGLDTSEANGGDDICLNIKDVSSGETVATGNFNELNTIMFSEWVAGLLLKYPNISMKILSELSHRLAQSETQTTRATERVELRIALFLVESIDHNSKSDVITLPMSKKDFKIR